MSEGLQNSAVQQAEDIASPSIDKALKSHVSDNGLNEADMVSQGNSPSRRQGESDNSGEEIDEAEYKELQNEAVGKGLNPDEVSRTRRKIKKIDAMSPLRKSPTLMEQSGLVGLGSQFGSRFIQSRISEYLDNYDDVLWQNDPHDVVSNRFLRQKDYSKLFVWVDESGLRMSEIDPPQLEESQFDQDFAYFLKIPLAPQDSITEDNISDYVIEGLVKQNYLKALLKQMNVQFIPQFMHDTSWPDNVKKEFLSQLHKFMATLTEHSYQQEGFTELYIPNEDLSNIANAGHDKDLLQRLEATLLHWYRQIKDIVNNQDSQQDNENAGPLDEIAYWRSRKNNLSHIHQQLDKPELKRIIQILTNVDSQYVKSFEDVTENIKVGSVQAENNLDFLKSLYEPCKQLETASPKEIPDLLPSLLYRVRMIWEHSKHYNSQERISGLLHKISNEIIKRCKQSINIDDMLDGDVEKCMQDLRDSIECGRKWKRIYEKTAVVINKKATQVKGPKWDFNLNSIFAQIDAFVQRCTELIEICEGQLQFARRGSESHIPQFGGSRGPEIEHILEEIKESFGKHLLKIKGSDKDKILDVKATKWHDEFSVFKNGVKDLDVMYQNIINFAFESVATVQQGVEMLEAFDQLSKRETIKTVVRKKALYVMILFVQELDATKQEFDNMKRVIPMPIGHGKYSGQCIWVRSLVHRIEKMKEWIDKIVFVDDSIKRQPLEKYEQVYQSFRQFITGKHKDWKEENKELEDAILITRLDRYVLYRADDKCTDLTNKKDCLRSKIGHLESNFDRQILRLMNEVAGWKKLLTIQIVIPPYADDFTVMHKENLRVLREQVLLVVRDFNNIIDYMNDIERKLFKQHLEQVEKVLYPGQARLRWSAKNILDGFVRECRRACNELFIKLKMFKSNTERIDIKCNEISQRILIKIDRKKVYDHKMFEEEQEKHRKDMYTKLKVAFDEIKRILCETYEPFVFDRLEIQKVWFRYVQQIDNKIEESFKKAVKNSLLDLQKIVGDDKINPIPIFKLSVELENNQLEFRPSTEYLIQMITQTMAAMMEVMRDFKRMEIVMQEERKKKLEDAAALKEKDQKNNPLAAAQHKKQELTSGIQFDEDLGLKKMDEYFERISEDPDVEKYTSKILDSLKNTCQQLSSGEIRDPWKKTEWYWSNSNYKEKYAKENLSRNDPVSNYKTQIENFEFFQGEIQAQHTTAKQGCIILDNTSIKSTLVDIMILWQNAILKAIEDKALSDLNALYTLFQNGESNLSPIPQDLHQLKKNMDLWNKLTEEKPAVEAKLGPLEDKFKLLDEYSIILKEEDIMKRNGLREAWQSFNVMLERIQQRNQKVHNDLYLETQKDLEEFVKETSDSKIVFSSYAPYQANNMDNDRAFVILGEYKDQAKALRKREELMKFGFDLFSINYSASPDLEFMEKEISSLENVWNTKEKWDVKYRQFCTIKFNEVNDEELDEEAEEYIKNLNAYTKEMKKWEIVNYIRANIDQFRQTLPLVKMLREKYMRERHWDKLKQHLGALIEPESDSFTLNEIFKMNLNSQADAVREVCDVAREEFKIESALEKIEKKWVTMELEMEPFKKTYKVKRPEDIYSVLEENMGTLSAQKTTIFYDSFKSVIEHWENTLLSITETLEMLLQVQRQWIYLESIFSSQQQESEKQLVGDISKFQAVHSRLAFHMNRIQEDRNCKRALCVEGFLADLQDMSRKLDESQKILYQLLERQRKDFPRFYFLSNDDLFELLGNSKDVTKVNKHIKKCFEGIKKFEILTISIPSGRGKLDVYEVAAMVSPEGEAVKFLPKVPCDQQLEKWLQACERMMRDVLKKELLTTLGGIRKKEGMRWVDKWIKEHPGQLLITASQLNWTSECFNAINTIYMSEKQDKNRTWRVVKEEKAQFLNELTKLVRKNAGEVDRLKLVALITIEVHNRDLIEHLQKNCFSPTSFEWLKQLRFSGVAQGDAFECKCEQTNTSFPYGYEYQGNNGRLVVTALTDRCYMTLTTAMVLKKGGAPQGPAGTGKTETVKDLGKTMAKFVLVFNCSEGLDYKSIGRMFSGLVQTGGWGCFDEFNRIEVEVLSVVAQQMNQIMNALKEYEKNKDKNSFQLEAEVIQINDQVAIFITMNPGYAGRSELPDNLKSLFRPVSMMVPESSVICEIMLQSEGFKNGRILSTKMVTLYNLMVQQLSKQDHYDFGLRAIKSVLNCAGYIRREKGAEPGKGDQQAPGGKTDKEREKEMELEEQNQETIILMIAIRDMNMPKFVAEDVPLFNALFNDLFPNMDVPETQNEVLKEEIEVQMKLMQLQPKPELVTKVIQLFDSKNTRHGNMLVGESLSGKSTCWKVLIRALNKLNERDPIKYPKVRIEVLNPKSVTINELFGYVNPQSMEWNEGVLSSMMSRLCKDESLDQRWMILDGPVDTMWIESMNTVLDDNKVLTLLNSDRIALPPQVGLIFELQDLAVASPATVSRAGMIYLDINDLGWRPYLESWIEKIKDTSVQESLWEFVEKWLPRLLKQRKFCKETVPCSESNIIISMCNLLECFVRSEQQLNFDTPNKTEQYWMLLEKWFTFAVIWSIGATVDEDGRKMIDYTMRDIESMFPHSNTVYDYFINNDKNDWVSWDDKIGAGVWKPASNLPYHKMLVPTTDSIRNRYILAALLKNKKFALAVGLTGTGKSVVINGILQELDESYTYQSIIFSAQTSSLKTQDMIESRLVKRSKNKMIPDGKKLVIFVDDLNMPRKDTYGSQPALELLRQWMDYDGWFDRTQRDLFKYIIDVQVIAAMGPSGGGRAEITRRIQTKFNVINFTFPSDTQVRRIYQSILTYKFQEFDEEIKPLAESLTLATYNLFRNVQDNFLPTPAKSHYVFNMRDISKVIQGIYQLDRFYCDNKLTVLRMWVHENLRVFHDRLINLDDRAALKKLISDQLEQVLQTNMKECSNENEDDTIFADFMEESGGKYVEVPYKERDNMKQYVEQKLKEYNNKTKASAMNIVLFQEALHYVCKINRIIKLGKGHGMLVGEGGAGRHSLTRLASFIADYRVWEIEVSKHYKMKEFREDVKRWAEEAGFKNKSGVFIFSDNQIVNEGFIEDINNILTVGEVPNLFNSKEDYPLIKDKIKKEYLRELNLDKDARVLEEDLMDFFFTRVQSNFHMMLLMSKTGDNLRNYCRMYPGLVNNTTMIWYMPWPQEALIEVAERYLNALALDKQITDIIAIFFGSSHQRVLDLSNKMWQELKRRYYVTPTNYIELVQGYTALLHDKQVEIGGEIFKLHLGLKKLDDAATNSEELQKMLSVYQIELSKKSKDCEDLMIKIESEQRDANEKQKEVETRSAQVDKEKIEVKILAGDAQMDLEQAEPALRAAEQGLENLKKDQLAEVRAYNKPPPGVDGVLSSIMIILGKDPSWASSKRELTQPDFLQKLRTVDKDHILQKTLQRIEKITHDPEMSVAKIDGISTAVGSLWRWVLAMEMYSKAFKDIEPKRAKVKMLTEKLKRSEDELHSLRDNFEKLKVTIVTFNNSLLKAQQDMQNYSKETTVLQAKLERADKLISGLASTKQGWADRRSQLQGKQDVLIGDALLSAAFLSYCGPFPSEYRDAFVNQGMLQVKNLKIPYSKDYMFADFLVRPVEFLKWSLKGLPDDQFSKENGVLVTKGRRWPLMIDPQLQANTWVKTMEREIDEKKVLVLDPQSDKMMPTIEMAISQGFVVILQNLDEEIDPAIEPILNKSLKKVAGKLIIYLGEKEILYNSNFRFYMTTKLSNPQYKAEVSTRVTLVNFTVKQKGLEEQLISVVIQKIEISLEKSKNDLVLKKASNESKLRQLDDDILKMLQDAKGSLIDDENLIKVLEKSKETEEEVRHQIETSAVQMKKTFAARENYRSLARIASKLFFIVNNFALIDTMYQFALDNYIQQFGNNIDNYLNKGPSINDSLQEKLQDIGSKHCEEVFRYSCRGLFEKDKLLLALQMSVGLVSELKPGTTIDLEEFNFFLRGGDLGLDRKGQPNNPCSDWIGQAQWDAICDLEKMKNFTGIIGAFTHNGKEWKRWYMSATPEIDQLPGEWDQKCDNLRKMIILKIIRLDRVLFAAQTFVNGSIGSFYISPPGVTYDSVYNDTNKQTPVIFILSPGVDPFTQLEAFAKQKQILLVPVSLGQGQAQKAIDKLFEAAKNGFWLYLANCHLSLSFLKELEKSMETLELKKDENHDNFRLWLSSSPHPKFPISILQKCIKVTTEPPKGVKANMYRMYSQMPPDKYQRVANKGYYKKLVFSLCWFHAIIIERKRFKSLGWNVIYDFNDSDWETADNILQMYVDQTQQDKPQQQANALGGQSDGPVLKSPPWDAIRYLIAEVTYGGRVTDEWDRRLLNVYANQQFSDRVIFEEKHKLVEGGTNSYIVPDELSQKEVKNHEKIGSEPMYYRSKVDEFPSIERPDVFGQHINAEISSQIADSNALIDSIMSLSSKTMLSGGESRESMVYYIIKELIHKLPEEMEMSEVMERVKPQDQNPLKIVLIQEITRYNKLISMVRQSLINLDKGISGLVLISEELEMVMQSLYEKRVPESWKFCYHSLKSLYSWIDDLIKRVDQVRNWALKTQPSVFWISGFSFPTGFTTALLQQSARRLNIPIDQFGWEYSFLPADSQPSAAKEGAYINGLYLEGAKWDEKNYIVDADPMKLYDLMPIIHFKPVYFEGKAKQKKGQNLYTCPTYTYPIRTGMIRPSYQFSVMLPCKPNPGSIQADQEFWVKRGTALLMSLAD